MTTYPEPLVARALGPKKSILVEVRRTMLKKGDHWVMANNVVNYTPAGLAALCRAMELDQQPVLDEVEKISPAAPPPPANAATTPAPATAAAEASPSPPGPTPPAVTVEPAAPATEEKKSPDGPAVDPAIELAAQVAQVAPKREAVDIVVSGRSPNPLIVFGSLDGKQVKVRVRNNANFIPGLVLTAKPSSDGPYLMIGHPPRWRGDKIGFARNPTSPIPTQ